MARKPSPWYWPERDGWFTILNGSRHLLGKHPSDLPPPQKRRGKWVIPQAIETAFHALFSAPGQAPVAKPSGGFTVSEILDKFLDWTQKNRAPRTYEWHHDHLQSFLNHLGKNPLPVADLKPFHVIEWVNTHANWSDTYRRGAIASVQRALNWAEELGYIAASPVKKIKKPQPKRRETFITAEGFAEIIANYKEGDPFRDLLLFCWHSGCRPQEANRLTNDSGVNPDKDRVRSVLDSFAPEPLYWSRLELPYRQLLVDLAEANSPEERAAHIAAWFWCSLYKTACTAFDSSIGQIDGGRDLKATTIGRGMLHRLLATVQRNNSIADRELQKKEGAA